MTAPGNDFLLLALSLGILLTSAYAIGRIHQLDRHGFERDEAYRLGYDKASHAIIGMIGSQDPPDGEKDAAAHHADPNPVAPLGRHARDRRLTAAEST